MLEKDETGSARTKMDEILRKYSYFNLNLYKDEIFTDDINEYLIKQKLVYINDIINMKNEKFLEKISEIDKDIQLYNLLKTKMNQTKDEKKINLKLEINQILSKYNYTPVSYLKKAIKKRQII